MGDALYRISRVEVGVGKRCTVAAPFGKRKDDLRGECGLQAHLINALELIRPQETRVLEANARNISEPWIDIRKPVEHGID